MTAIPHVTIRDRANEELIRIVEAYLREHDMPVIGTVLTTVLCNAAIDWWNALGPACDREPTP